MSFEEYTLLETYKLALAVFRIAGIFFITPFFGHRIIPFMVKIWFSLIVAVLMMPVVSGFEITLPSTVISLLFAVSREILVGVIIGFAGFLLLIGVQFAGQIVGIQMGFGIVNVIDPMSPGQVSIIGEFNYLIAILILIVIGGHHMFIDALAESYRVIPLGTAVFDGALSRKLLELSVGVFVVAVKFAAPIMATLFLMYVSLGIIARTVPQMNVFLVGFPVSIAVGLSILALSLPFFTSLFIKLVGTLRHDIFEMVHILTP